MIGAQVDLAEMYLTLDKKPEARAALKRCLDLAAKHPEMAQPQDVKHATELLAYAEGRAPAPK